MTQEDIRDLVYFQLFKPFRLRFLEEQDSRVPHPDYALVTVGYVVVANKLSGGVPGEINLVPYEHIARVEMLPRIMRKAA